MRLEEGQPAPDFTLPSDTGEMLSLSDLRGRAVVLYFYPKDDTPGCATQACGFRDAYGELEARGALVLGVSPDSESSHARFRAKHRLPFSLLADTGHEAAERYGVWVEKSSHGRKSMGIKRSTFVIDAEGTIAKAMYGVSPEGHAADVLAALAGLGRAAGARPPRPA